MKTYYSPGDIETPTVITLARDDGSARKKIAEALVARGVTSGGGLVEVLTDAKGATWTIIVTTPEGVSCLVADGEGWRTMPKPRDEGPAG